MTQNLVIVESPSKAKTIQKYLGQGFTVLSTMGHIRDLPSRELGINVNEDFKPLYVNLPRKTKTITQLKVAAAKADVVYLATDPDREGEAIGWHVSRVLSALNKPTHRILFYEITKAGVQKGIEEPRDLDMHLVDSQQARRMIDRLVGFKISPFLWKVLYSGLSAGRVQSVALRLICERQAEIDAFVPEEYWTLAASLRTANDVTFEAELSKIKGEKAKLGNEAETNAVLKGLESAKWHIEDVQTKRVKRNPYAPFTTSTLQQDAFAKAGFTTKRTMSIAQQLYEGVTLPSGETTGLITYMRTDSTRVSGDAVGQARDLISAKYGEKYLPKSPRMFGKAGQSNVQDAHEAIRPANPGLEPESVKNSLTGDQYKLYDLIWRRFIASQMQPAQFDQTAIDVLAGDDYTFHATGSDLVFPGFLKVYSDKEEGDENRLPGGLTAGERLDCDALKPEQHFTKPPAPYTESSLVKILDKEGIGRPSTYASIISVVQERKYVVSEKKKLNPTDLGKVTNQLLTTHFAELFNTEFTREMETELDKIETGELEWKTVMRQFYSHLETWLESSSKNYSEIKKGLVEEREEVCEKCGKPMVVKWSKFGRFLACTGYPKCKNTHPLDENGNPETAAPNDGSAAGTEELGNCPDCGAPMVLRSGRFGKFYACSTYPKCKYTKPYSTIMPCPKEGCNGQIFQRRSKRGKVFYGCSHYPKCDFVTWDEPVAKSCPNCESNFMVHKSTKALGDYLYCPKCKHKITSAGSTPDANEQS